MKCIIFDFKWYGFYHRTKLTPPDKSTLMVCVRNNNGSAILGIRRAHEEKGRIE